MNTALQNSFTASLGKMTLYSEASEQDDYSTKKLHLVEASRIKFAKRAT